jgi:glycerol-3-phosphate dehydrogenase
MNNSASQQPPWPVVILGAGINGCAIARELVANGVPVYVVDAWDIASGATSRSSRLIHGGLRYLEYGEIDLVQESLAERRRLLRLAPQYVQPLRFFVPVRTRLGGLRAALSKLLGWDRGGTPLHRLLTKLAGRGQERGLWLVRLGLWLYDTYARDPLLPPHSLHRTGEGGVPGISSHFRWLCAYSDAQMRFPERFVLALLEDARQLARAQGVPFQVFTYHRVQRRGRLLEAHPRATPERSVLRCEPAAIVNATGAWGDATLAELDVPAPRLFGGTKGSHLLTFHAGLRQALGQQAIYAEAKNGRLVFLLPFGEGVLAGTTDEPFDQPPETAVTSSEELDYLLEMVNSLFPALTLTRRDIALHYSGIRPLPYRPGTAPSAITRRHWIECSEADGIPLYTVVGGKLTTCLSLAEQATQLILASLGLPHAARIHERVVPGGKDYPATPEAAQAGWEELARRYGLAPAQVQAMWELLGTRLATVLEEMAQAHSSRSLANTVTLTSPLAESVTDTPFPVPFVRWVIRHEWVTTLADLVERRLLLLYRPDLSEACLRHLARLLAEEGRLAPSDVDRTVQEYVERLQVHYGKRIVLTLGQ